MEQKTGFTIDELTPKDVDLMEARLPVFGHAFEGIETYGNNRPSKPYLEWLLGNEFFIVLVGLKQEKEVGGLASYLPKYFEQERGVVY